MAAPRGLEQEVGGIERLRVRRRPHRVPGHRGAGAPARAGRRAARPSRPDGSPSTGARLLADAPVRHARGCSIVPIRRTLVPRAARPDDLYRLQVPFDPRLSPDGRTVAFTVTRSAVGLDGYRHAIWTVPVDGSGEARQVTLGARTDRHARFSPDGRTLAFLSDRRVLVEEEPARTKDPKDAKEREDAVQVHLLPLDGGEARRLTDLPRGVNEFAWSPGRAHARRADIVPGGDDGGRCASGAAGPRSRSRASPRCRTTGTSTSSATSTTAPGSSTTRMPTCGWWTWRPARRARWSLARRRRPLPPGPRTGRGSRSRPTGGGTRTSRTGRWCTSWTWRPAP